MQIQVSGSIAFDTIMLFEGRFRDLILPDQVHMLNVAFLAPQMRQEFGGCAANIAYSLRGLGSRVSVLGAIGRDGEIYLKRLASLGVNTQQVIQKSDCFTAQAFITTDLDDNQITAFHPGAMNHAEEAQVVNEPSLGIVSPNGKLAMISHARAFAKHQIPFVFDPGQALPIFSADELREMIGLASWLALNDYEGEMLVRQVGCRLEDLRPRLAPHPAGGILVTKGAKGVHLIQGHRTELPAVPVPNPVDPTGCGDAFRAGLLHGLANGQSLEDAARLGIVLGGLKVQHRGGQNHPLEANFLEEAWSKAFETPFPSL